MNGVLVQCRTNNEKTLQFDAKYYVSMFTTIIPIHQVVTLRQKKMNIIFHAHFPDHRESVLLKYNGIVL